jgi:hypothetical protein
MARPGIASTDVYKAANKLDAMGINPTIESVRREMGNIGSASTIAPLLKAWKENKVNGEINGLPAHLHQALLSIYEQMKVDNDTEIKNIRDIHQKSEGGLIDESEKLKKNILELEKQNISSSSELKKLSEELRISSKTNSSTRDENIKLTERVLRDTNYKTHIEKSNIALSIEVDSLKKELKEKDDEFKALTLKNSKLVNTCDGHVDNIAELKAASKTENEMVKSLAANEKQTSKLFKQSLSEFVKDKESWNREKAGLSNELKSLQKKVEKQVSRIAGLEKSLKAKKK